jgi:hypothetical protein
MHRLYWGQAVKDASSSAGRAEPTFRKSEKGKRTTEATFFPPGTADAG